MTNCARRPRPRRPDPIAHSVETGFRVQADLQTVIRGFTPLAHGLACPVALDSFDDRRTATASLG
jgi:hypothetical protein